MPTPAPQRKKVLAVYRLRETTDLSLPAIAKETGVPYQSVYLWLKHSNRFDPYYDAVAVRRVFDGDGDVYDRMTHYEKKLVIALLERADANDDLVTRRFPLAHQEKIRVAIASRRARVEKPRTDKHWKIAEVKLTPEVCAKAKSMRQKGIDFAIIGRQLGLSRSSVFTALRAAA